jgi:hypothetical protein
MTTATSFYRRGLGFAVRQARLRRLRADYRRGSANSGRVEEEEADPAIVDEGQALRRQALEANERKHAAAGYRVLMWRPTSITAEIWFSDLAQCMRHAGIECRVLAPDAASAEINAAFESFEPNIFVAREVVEESPALDLAFVQRYKRVHGCLRMLIPAWRAGAPGGFSTPELDVRRRQLQRNGLGADAHFSIYEPEFHERFSRDRDGPAIEHATIPQACNPFADFPVAVAKCHDYFMATTLTNERVENAYQFLRPILREYRGLWAGPRWGFGVEYMPPEQMPRSYAQTRIALSPLVGLVYRHAAELTHRVYAAAACGTFQLTMPTPITGRYFQPEELVQAASPAEYARLFAHYVDRPLERNAIAMAALRRAYGEHTCFHRIDKLVSQWDEWRRRGLF